MDKIQSYSLLLEIDEKISFDPRDLGYGINFLHIFYFF